MRVAICGANGFIGKNILRELVKDGYEVVRIGREHFKKEDALFNSLESCEVIINLCGAPIIKKWDEVYKHELYVSRIETTKRFIKEIKKLKKKPKLFISVSSVGIYKEDLVHDENSLKFGTSYLALLAKEWENEAKKSEELGVKCIIFRLGVVLGINGGALSELKFSFKLGFGTIIGDGKQPFSWVHIDDVVNVFKMAIKSEKMQGIYNLVAPESVNMKTFIKTFGKIIRRPVLLKMPNAIMKYRYAEGAENLLKGSFVIPKKLEKEGYVFKYNDLYNALENLL